MLLHIRFVDKPGSPAIRVACGVYGRNWNGGRPRPIRPPAPNPSRGTIVERIPRPILPESMEFETAGATMA
jgi:hypothetical protein